MKKAHRNDDYLGVFPEGIFPTGDLDVLERGGSLLFIKSYPHGHKIMPPHKRIFTQLVRLGEAETSPGSVSVLCVWGLGETAREYVIFDARGMSERKVTDIAGMKNIYFVWWQRHKGRR